MDAGSTPGEDAAMGQDAGMDGKVPDATDGSAADAGAADGSAADAGADDAGADASTCGTADLAPKACTHADDCSAEETCLKGACIRHCGADLSEFETGLGAAFTPVAGFCGGRDRTTYAYPTTENGCDRFQYYGLNTYGEGGTNNIHWVLRSYEVKPPQVNIATRDLGLGTNQPTWDGLSWFQSGALSPAGDRIVFSMFDEAYNGLIFALTLDAPVWTQGPAILARGVSFFGPDVVLLAAGDLQALSVPFTAASSVTTLATGLGSANAVMDLPERGFVVVQSNVTSGESDLYFVPSAKLTAVLGGAGPLDAASDADVGSTQGKQWLTAFGSDYLVQWNDVGDRTLHALSVSDGDLVLGAGVPFATSALVEQLVYLGDKRVLVRYRDFAHNSQGGVYGTLD